MKNSIYTSYFSNYKNFPENSFIVSVARKLIFKVDCYEYTEVAPPKSILYDYKYNDLPKEEYTKQYLDYLKTVDMNKFMKFLLDNVKTKNIILCCYESSGFCHRHILRKILNNKYPKLDIKEL